MLLKTLPPGPTPGLHCLVRVAFGRLLGSPVCLSCLSSKLDVMTAPLRSAGRVIEGVCKEQRAAPGAQ